MFEYRAIVFDAVAPETCDGELFADYCSYSEDNRHPRADYSAWHVIRRQRGIQHVVPLQSASMERSEHRK